MTLSETDKALLNLAQQQFPQGPEPYAELGRQLGLSASEVITRLTALQQQGILQRVGPVFRPHRLGVSTLAALAVPEPQLEAVAAFINGFDEVNHNYEREHRYNLWFVLTASSQARLEQVLNDIRQHTRLPLLNLPLTRSYHIDLGFAL